MKRTQKPRKIRDTILIITNGKKTEKNYFSGLTNSFRSMFSIKVEPKNMECDEMVGYASRINKDIYNQIWCVFDIDESFTEGHLIRALELAKQNNINIAYSNEAFEIWLMYHYVNNLSDTLTRKDYINKLTSILKDNNIDEKYLKNDDELLRNYFIPKSLEAAEIAKKVYQKHEAEHQQKYMGNKGYRIWEWKNTTTVYKLIENLKLTPKE